MMTEALFDELRGFVEIPPHAAETLMASEMEMQLSLTLKLGEGEVLRAPCYVVYHCTVRGPAKGGIRFAPFVSLQETRDLAERMTWKTALARLPFGGGKAGIDLDPADLSRFQKTAVLKELVHLIALELSSGRYIPAPDLGTTATDMAIIYGEIHRPESVTGKPPAIGGLPGRREATGFGVAHAVRLALSDILHQAPEDTTVAIQGFGNVGGQAARFLWDAKMRVVAVSDVHGGVYAEKGLDIPALLEHANDTGSVPEFAQAEHITNEELLALDVDVLIPAAVENVLTEATAPQVRARLIVEGANGPTTPAAEAILRERHIPVLPDFLANAGGVIASYVEWYQGKSGAMTTAEETLETVRRQVELAFRETVATSTDHGCSLRTSAMSIAARELVRSLHQRDWI